MSKPICFHHLKGLCAFPKCYKLHLTQEQWREMNVNLSPCFEYCATGICTGHNGQGCNFAKTVKDYKEACQKRGKMFDQMVVLMLEQGAEKEKVIKEVAIKVSEEFQAKMMAEAVIEAEEQAKEQDDHDEIVDKLEKELKNLSGKLTKEEEDFCEEVEAEYERHVQLANKKVTYAEIATPSKVQTKVSVPGAPVKAKSKDHIVEAGPVSNLASVFNEESQWSDEATA